MAVVAGQTLYLPRGCCCGGGNGEGRGGPGQGQLRGAAAAAVALVPHLSRRKELPVRCPGSPGAHGQGHTTLFTISPPIRVATRVEKKRKHSQ